MDSRAIVVPQEDDILSGSSKATSAASDEPAPSSSLDDLPRGLREGLETSVLCAKAGNPDTHCAKRERIKL